MRRGLAREAPVVVWALALALLVLGPALGYGFLLVRDMVWVPDLALRADALGLGSGLPRAVPSDAVVAVMDETDSGLDIDALRVVANAVNAMRGPELGILIITHYQRILGYVEPDHVHIMLNGRVVEEGGPDLATELEQKGYEWVRELHPEEVPA